MIAGRIKSAARRLSRAAAVAPRRFALVTGAPRSGTTAMMRWLNDSRDICSFSETRVLIAAHGFLRETSKFWKLDHDAAALIPDLRRLVIRHYAQYAWLPRYRVVLDKEPLEPTAFPERDYEGFLANVVRVFPQARIMYMLRHPVATVWSMNERSWGTSLTSGETRRLTLQEHVQTWRDSARIIRLATERAEGYVCVFERLVGDAPAESARVREFLGLAPGPAFAPRATKEIGFSERDRDRILKLTRSERERLAALGIADYDGAA